MPNEKEHEPKPMSYEHASHLLNPLRRLILSPKTLVKRLNLRANSNVLELGPGPGYFSIEIAKNIPMGSLVLVDIQQEMLDMAKKRLEQKGIVNVQYLIGDAVSIPAESESFDVVFLASVLGEVPDRIRCLREIHRVLRLQGLLSVTEQLGDPDFIPMSELHKLVQNEGFYLQKTFGFSRNYTANYRKKLF